VKKIVIRTFIALVVLILLAGLAVHFFLNGAIKRGVETVGPKLTKTEVKLNTVTLSIFSGSGKMKGLLVGNPEGFKTPSAINVGTASLELQPRSVFSDKVIVKSILVENPEITFETDLRNVNLKTILANIEQATGGTEGKPSQPKEPAAKAGKKLQVDDFRIIGSKLHVTLSALGNSQSASVNLPEIALKNLGQGPEGITAAELSKRVLQVLIEKAEQQAGPLIADMSKNAKIALPDLGVSGSNTVDKVTRGLGDLIKKKP
jgi:uncharacterized protein involved in outer membrane biogenesis